MKSLSPVQVSVIVTALTLVWGTQYLLVRDGVRQVPPLLFGAARFAVVVVAAQLVVSARRPPALPAELQKVRLAYVLCHAVAMGALYWGQARIPSALAAVLGSLGPVLLGLLAYRVEGESRPNVRVVVANVIGLAGTAMVVLDARDAGGPSTWGGILAVLAATLASVGTRLAARRLTGEVSAWVLLRDMGLAVAAVLGVGAWLLERDAQVHWTPAAVVTVGWLGLVGSVAATGLYLVVLRQVSVGRLGYLQFGTAVVAVLTGAALGGETWSTAMSAGMGFLLVGLLAVIR